MFASTVFTSIYQKITNLFKSHKDHYIESLENKLSALDYDELRQENENLKKDFWDLAKVHNQLKNDYDDLKKHDEWLNDMLLDSSEPVIGFDAPIVEHETLKIAAI